MAKWSENIWKAAEIPFRRILRHPFVCGLADGSLPAQCFVRYLAQDELYLPQYRSLMLRLAELLPSAADREFLRGFADAGVESEQEMHRKLTEKFGAATGASPSATTLAYCSFLRSALDGGSAPEAMAAMLPCSWVYCEVGRHLLATARLEGNPYREWIEEYGDTDYRGSVLKMVSVADSLAAAASPEELRRMDEAFLEALGFEFAFWNNGYEQPQ